MSYLLLAISVASITGCYRVKTYRGDGRIVAIKVGNWFINCTRYTVLLGPIDLAKKNVRVFRLQGLPSDEMNLSLEVGVADGNTRIDSEALVKFELVDEAGKIIVQEESRFDQAAWSISGLKEYGYRASLYIGNAFKPDKHSKYTLAVEVIEPNKKAIAFSPELAVWSYCP
jgi:hypothetical protein